MAIQNDELKKALIDSVLLNVEKLEAMEKRAETQKVSLEEFLFESQALPDDQLGKEIAKLYDVPFVDLSNYTIKESLLSIVPARMALGQLIIPFELEGDVLRVAMNNPHNFELITFIENKTGYRVESHYATGLNIRKALKVYNRDVNEKFNELLKGALTDPSKIESLQDASKLVDAIVLFAQQNGASDIHMEPQKEFLMIRYRVDGLLKNVAELPIQVAELLTTRIKVLSRMRTDEHRAAQDGRFKLEVNGVEVTLRVSIIPVYDGEKVVMRLLSSTNQELNLKALGYSDFNLKRIEEGMKKTHGILLLTGPTGSGKTTTLYSIMKMLNSPDVNISTIEDPIEYRLAGVNQTQVNRVTDLTFANGLRALVRQDPDIIMVGEIRDQETATVAINAALTGHLVLATLHTNDAASSLPRLMEMGVESFLISATAKMVVAQRLIRKVCEHCKSSYKLNLAQIEALSVKFDLKRDFTQILEWLGRGEEKEFVFYRGEGCEICGNSGYKGRTTIAEVMTVSDEIQKNILEMVPATQLEAVALKEGMTSMFMDGMDKVFRGETTIEEILRVMRD